MTRWFHAIAAALLVLALWTGPGRDTDSPSTPPKAKLVALLAASGLTYRGEQPLFAGGSVLRFRQAACPSDFELVYLPSLSRIAPAEVERLGVPGGRAIFVHDGDVVGGLGPLDLAPRWLWRKLLAAVRLRPSEPWQSAALALFVPSNCASPPVDWRALTLAH
jgi:hypothetical protein